MITPNMQPLVELSPGELALRLGVLKDTMVRALDAGERPPGVESVYRTPGGHRRVRWRPPPPVVFVSSSSLAPAETTLAGFVRPWAHVARTQAVQDVAELCTEHGAELVLVGSHGDELRAAFRSVGFLAVEYVPSMVRDTDDWLTGRAQQWLRRQREVGYPRDQVAILPDVTQPSLELAAQALGATRAAA